MEIINQQNLKACIRDAVRAELHEHFTKNTDVHLSERLLSETDPAEELGISLVTLNLWMKKGPPFLRLHKTIYFKRSEIVSAMQQNQTLDFKKNEIRPYYKRRFIRIQSGYDKCD